MRNVVVVARREILALLRRPSFYVAALVAPLIVGALFFGFGLLEEEFGDDSEQIRQLSKPAGYVDQAGVVTQVPPSVQQFILPFEDEAAATAALRDGAIQSYFVVRPDYRETGRVVRVARQVTFTSGSGPDTRVFRAVLRANLAGDLQIAQRLDIPLDLEMNVVRPSGESRQAGGGPFEGSAAFPLGLLLAFSIVNGGGWLVQAVVEEKENRTIEIVLTSLRPWQLMAGKLLGLGVIALLQLGIYLGLLRALLGRTGPAAGLSAGEIPASMWPWLVLFFLLGFLFVGGLMMAMGAVGASARESGQISGFMSLPVMMPLWFGEAISDSPSGLLGIVLSLVPITAPVTMTMRLAAGGVPLWQILLSAALLTLGVAGVIWLTARLFRGTTLLTGTRPTPLALWRAVRAR